LAAIFAIVFGLVYLPVIELEEQHLRNLFPDYATYAQRVPRLVPLRFNHSGNSQFSWALYRKNEEYKALLGFLAAVAWLLIRLYVYF
jgi:hypothetical protein